MLLFTKRPLKCEKIDLIENGKNFSNNTELYNIFNDFFSDINIPNKYHCFLTHLPVTYALRISKVESLI